MTDLQPCYNFDTQSGCICLAKDLPCSFTIGQEEFNCRAKVIYNVISRIEIRTDVSLDIRQYLTYLNSQSNVKCIILNGEKIPVILTFSPLPTGQTGITLTSRKEPFPIIGNDGSEISTVIFHLFNFKNEIGTYRKRIQEGNTFYYQGITELISKKWKVELHEVRNPKESGKKNNTPTLTHIGCLTRIDHSVFDGKAAQQILYNLRLFFTFSQGTFCSPEMPVGFDENNNKVWALGSSPGLPITGSMSWFDPHHSDQLAKLFPNFILKIEDERWRETFHTVIYWYARSNNSSGGGIDTGIILAQIALERLAYECSLDFHEEIGPDNFDKLNRASKKLHYLFSHLDIPLDLPENFIKIKELAKREKLHDAPQLLTSLRNSMVHPDNKRRGQFKGFYYNAWRLGLWYLELTILRICDYQGTYFNRLSDELWVGDVEKVPWLK